DPITALTQSPYGYVGGSPLNGTDPLGLFCLLGHVNGDSGSCRGTNIATDLKVVGLGLSVLAVSVTPLALAAPELAVAGVELSTISFGLGIASTLTSAGVAGIDCARDGLDKSCKMDIAETALSGVSTAFSGVGITKGITVLRVLAGGIGIAASTVSI